MDKKVYFFSLMLMFVVSITMGRDALAQAPEESGIVERTIFSEPLAGEMAINPCNEEEVTIDTGQLNCLVMEIEKMPGESLMVKCSGGGSATGSLENDYTIRLASHDFNEGGQLRVLVKFVSPTAPNFYAVAVEVEMDGVERVEFENTVCAPGGPIEF